MGHRRGGLARPGAGRRGVAGGRPPPAGVGPCQPPGARGALHARSAGGRLAGDLHALVVLSAAGDVHGRRRRPGPSHGRGRRGHTARLPRSRHGGRLPARPPAGGRARRRRRGASLRCRAVRRVLDAALPARSAAGGDGHARPGHAAGDRRFPPARRDGAPRRRVRARPADEADVRALHRAAGRVPASARRPPRAAGRCPRHADRRRAEPALVRAAAARPRRPGRRARVQPGRRVGPSRHLHARRPGLLPAAARLPARPGLGDARRARPRRGVRASAVVPAGDGPHTARRAGADPQQEPALRVAAARRPGDRRRAGPRGAAGAPAARRHDRAGRDRRRAGERGHHRGAAQRSPPRPWHVVGPRHAAEPRRLASPRHPGAARARPPRHARHRQRGSELCRVLGQQLPVLRGARRPRPAVRPCLGRPANRHRLHGPQDRRRRPVVDRREVATRRRSAHRRHQSRARVPEHRGVLTPGRLDGDRARAPHPAGHRRARRGGGGRRRGRTEAAAGRGRP